MLVQSIFFVLVVVVDAFVDDDEELQNLGHVEPFNENAIYPKGTLLLRTWNPVDVGHISMLIETGKRVVDCHLLHTIGGAFQKHGEVVTDEDLVSDCLLYTSPSPRDRG